VLSARSESPQYTAFSMISQDWREPIRILGAMNILVELACLGLWVQEAFLSGRFRRPGSNQFLHLIAFLPLLLARNAPRAC